MILTQYFKITGVANAITYDDGLKSTDTEKKILHSVRLLLNGQADNQVQIYHERSKLQDWPDRLIDVEVDAFSTNTAKPGARVNELEVGFDIPLGESVKMAIKCGATAKDVYGAYIYELKA